jgi:predicted CoA-binding protein
MNQQNPIQKILQSAKTIAVVGMSAKPHRAGYYVPAYLQEQGYRVIPVNPFLHGPVLGEQPYNELSEVPEPVDLVLIFQRSANVPPFVDQAIKIGAKAVWMQLGIAHAESAEKARAAGLDVVMDACMLVEHKNAQHKHNKP